jgi:NAD(P)H-dependent flavin oxidoreductase YrpB (nitropropane dioxygenase family)
LWNALNCAPDDGSECQLSRPLSPFLGLTEIPDIAAGVVWPGAMSRAKRNGLIERWAGREWTLRQRRTEVLAYIQAARKAGDVNDTPLLYGQDPGLINDILPAGEIVRRIAKQAEDILSKRLPALIK